MKLAMKRNTMQNDGYEQQGLMAKYKERLKNELLGKKEAGSVNTSSYQTFRKEQLPRHLSMYEQYANLAAKLLKLNPKKKDKAAMQEYLSLSHLATTPSGVMSLAAAVAALSGIAFHSPRLVALQFAAFGFARNCRRVWIVYRLSKTSCFLCKRMALENKQSNGAVHFLPGYLHATHIKSGTRTALCSRNTSIRRLH